MVYTDQTSQFRALVAESSRSKSPSRSSPAPRRSKEKGKERSREEEFLKEAYRIQNHLSALTTLLQTVRKPYLSSADPPPLSRRQHQNTRSGPPSSSLSGDDESAQLRRYEGSKWLSDRERDEIDMRGRMILRRCREMVGELERGEKTRQITTHPLSALATFLPSLAPQSTNAFEPLFRAHHSTIIWYLNDRLSKTTTALSNLQEERAKRREERGRSLGGQAAKEAARLEVISQSKAKSGSGGVASIGEMFGISNTTPSSSSTKIGGATDNDGLPNGIGAINPTDEPPIESQLTSAQLLQLESENSTLLNQMESTLSSVLAAEKSLLEVSTLQTELIKNLAQQTEMTDRLYDEAVGSVGEMGKANVQLKQAKKRGEEGRLFLLIFLVGASMALLFLDWYSH